MDDSVGASWVFSGTWPTQDNGAYYGGQEHLSNSASATATFSFVIPAGFEGTVTLVGERWPTGCDSNWASVDGTTAVQFSQVGELTRQFDSWTSPTLSEGSHSMTVLPCGSGPYLIVDAARVDSSPVASTTTSSTSSTTSTTSASTTTTVPPSEPGTSSPSAWDDLGTFTLAMLGSLTAGGLFASVMVPKP